LTSQQEQPTSASTTIADLLSLPAPASEGTSSGPLTTESTAALSLSSDDELHTLAFHEMVAPLSVNEQGHVDNDYNSEVCLITYLDQVEG
jgi:hypothetical protein